MADEIKSERLENPDGPRRDRSITDCLFCLIMIAFWGGTIAVFSWAFASGNPYLLTQTYDFKGTPCGLSSNGTSSYPYTYFYNPVQNFTNVVCLSSCPTWANGTSGPVSLPCYSPQPTYNLLINSCTSNFTVDINTFSANSSFYSTVPFLIYNTTTLFNRFCIPSASNLLASGLASLQNITAVTQAATKTQQYLSDVTACWKYFLIIGAIAMGLALIMLIFIRCCAGLMVWLTLIFFIGSVFGLAVICGVESSTLSNVANNQVQTNNSFASLTSSDFYALEIFFYVLGSICVVIILFSIPTIMITIAVIKSTAMFVYSNLTVLFVPLFTGIVVAGYIVFWIVIFLYIFSVGTYTQASNSPFANVKWNTNVQWLMVYHVLSLLWNVAFFNYYGVFVIACTCCLWYFNSEFSGGSFFSFPVITSAWWGIRYHLGSIALGSFILMLFWSIQLVLGYLAAYIEGLKKNGIESKILDLFIKCLMCYVACFTRVIEFISELGYAQIAITSKNFCTSCMEAFKLLVSNPMKFGVVSFVGTTFVFIGNLFVAATCGVLGWLLITYDKTLIQSLNETIIPTFFFIVIGYFVATIFFSVFGTSANTVLLCFFYDKELASKSGRPPNAPEPMREFYEKYKKVD